MEELAEDPLNLAPCAATAKAYLANAAYRLSTTYINA